LTRAEGAVSSLVDSTLALNAQACPKKKKKKKKKFFFPGYPQHLTNRVDTTEWHDHCGVLVRGRQRFELLAGEI
jgi:hypothetical protein